MFKSSKEQKKEPYKYEPSQKYKNRIQELDRQKEKIESRIQLNEPRIRRITVCHPVIDAYPKVIKFILKIMTEGF